MIIAALFRVSGLGWWQSRRARKAAAIEAAASARSGQALPSSTSETTDRKVHWARSPETSQLSSTTSSSSSLSSIIPPQPHTHHHHPHRAPSARYSPPFDLDPTVFYIALLFILIRTPHRREKLRKLVRFLVVGLPSSALAGVRGAALRVLLGKEGARGALKQEKLRRG
jgi:hypothetical protein